MVARSASGSPTRPWPKYSTNFPTTPRLRRICVTARTRSVAVAPSGSCPVSRKPTTCGTSMETGSPRSTASASIPPTPQPRTPRPLTMVVCESVPISVSGKANERPPSSRVSTTRARYSRFTWWTIPVFGGTTLKLSNARLPPAEEGVALAVPLELALGVPEDGQARAELVHLDGVVDDELGGDLRVDRCRVAAQRHHRLAHGGEVDDRRHAREVLQEDAGGAERDLVARLGLGVPARDCAHLLRAPVAERLGAEHVLEQHAKGVREPGEVGLRTEGVEPRDRVRRDRRRRSARALRRCPHASILVAGFPQRDLRLRNRRATGSSAGTLSPWPRGRSRGASRSRPGQPSRRRPCSPVTGCSSLSIAAAAVAAVLVGASLLSARDDGGGGGDADVAVGGGPDVEACSRASRRDGTTLGEDDAPGHARRVRRPPMPVLRRSGRARPSPSWSPTTSATGACGSSFAD